MPKLPTTAMEVSVICSVVWEHQLSGLNLNCISYTNALMCFTQTPQPFSYSECPLFERKRKRLFSMFVCMGKAILADDTWDWSHSFPSFGASLKWMGIYHKYFVTLPSQLWNSGSSGVVGRAPWTYECVICTLITAKDFQRCRLGGLQIIKCFSTIFGRGTPEM